MARMPGVAFLGNQGRAMTEHDIVCVHTIVGFQAGGNAAHFTTGATGRIVQSRDTGIRSEANLDGNWHVIAIENEDHGLAYKWDNDSTPPRFTPQQAEAIARILVWCHKRHKIPLTLVPNSKVGNRGIAYHRQGIDGNFTGKYRGRVAGGEKWSDKFGKVCPGEKRIDQLIDEIIPRARVLAGDGAETQEDDMYRLFQIDGKGAVYLTNFVTFRKVENTKELSNLKAKLNLSAPEKWAAADVSLAGVRADVKPTMPFLVQEAGKPSVYVTDGTFVWYRHVRNQAELKHLTDRLGEVQIWKAGTLGVLGVQVKDEAAA